MRAGRWACGRCSVGWGWWGCSGPKPAMGGGLQRSGGGRLLAAGVIYYAFQYKFKIITFKFKIMPDASAHGLAVWLSVRVMLMPSAFLNKSTCEGGASVSLARRPCRHQPAPPKALALVVIGVGAPVAHGAGIRIRRRRGRVHSRRNEGGAGRTKGFSFDAVSGGLSVVSVAEGGNLRHESRGLERRRQGEHRGSSKGVEESCHRGHGAVLEMVLGRNSGHLFGFRR